MKKSAANWMALALLGPLLLAFTPRPSAAEEKLIMTTMSPAGSDNDAKFFLPWVARVNAAARGSIEIDPRDGQVLANYTNIYERVQDDVVQIGWTIQAILGGQFPLSSAIGLPFMVANGTDGSVAFWRLYKAGLLDSEFKDIVPVFVGVHPPAELHFSKPLKSLESIDGLKISVSSASYSKTIEALGGAAQSIPPQDFYEALQRGMVNGILIAWGSFETYKFQDVTSYHIDEPLGTITSVFFMSKKKFASLPKAAQDALMENGGEKESREFGKYLDSEADFQREAVAADKRHTIVTLNPQQSAAWKAKIRPIIDSWESSHANGKEIVDTFLKIYAEVKTH